ncbi:MAG: ribbon-helix-helix protein, CopG family [Solirubrobacterales bacterium]|nr:ribbon-helix-helix protein, CopG family [Solirubrobacterales bacterium]
MTLQIAVRIPDDQLQELDNAVQAGEFESRAEGVRQALRRLLSDLREREIAREYRQAYARQPDDPAVGEAGVELLAEAVRREESQPS